jgi:soluble lytic murein transglycosylase-like protein
MKKIATTILKYLAAWFLIGYVIGCAITVANAEPVAARQYRNEVIREARAVWGLNAPVAVMAGQVEQESGWRPDVCSPYACGLTQFTPATATWISGLYSELAGSDVFNPSWAIRALVRYDFRLYGATRAATDMDKWSFALSAYNGGLGTLRRELSLCTMSCDTWAGVSPLRARAIWAHKENRSYVSTILERRQFTYAGWGSTV